MAVQLRWQAIKQEEIIIQNTERTLQELGSALRKAKAEGITLVMISDRTRVARPLISNLCNHGSAAIGKEDAQKLWDWVEEYNAEAHRNKELEPSPEGSRNCREVQFIPTTSFLQALGMCQYGHENNEMVVVVGNPGVGKTTLANKLKNSLQDVIYIEAWEMMRIGDLIDEIAEGLGISVSGTTVRKIKQIERVLKSSKSTLVIDEAEMLSKWDNSKLEMLRKIWDHTGISMVFLGVQKFEKIVDSEDARQFGRRMFKVHLTAPTQKEMMDAMLRDYNISKAAAEELAKIACNVNRGGMGTWSKLLKMCLDTAEGMQIELEHVENAGRFKFAY